MIYGGLPQGRSGIRGDSVTTQLEGLGYQTAVIYGGLPPGRSHIGGEGGGDCDNTTIEPGIPNYCDIWWPASR